MRLVFLPTLFATLFVFAFWAECVGQATINTTMGRGADATIANDEPDGDMMVNQFFADDARGTVGAVEARMFVDDIFFATIRHRVGLFRFDLAGLSGDLTGAHLEWHSIDQGRTLDFFVLNDTDETTENWDEATVTYNTAPGLLGPQPYPTSYVSLDPSQVTEIGSWAVPGPNSGGGFPVNFTVVSRPTPMEGAEPGKVYDDNIAPEFSQNLAAAIAADTNDLLTLIMIHTGADDPAYGGNNGNITILSKEGLVNDMNSETPVGYFFNPSLVLPNAMLEEPGGLDGDYNGNMVVDAADYTLWRDTRGQMGVGLAADGTGPGGVPDGVVDDLDYDFWVENFGNTAGSGSGALSAAGNVPEPSAAWLAWAAACCAMGLASRRRWAGKA